MSTEVEEGWNRYLMDVAMANNYHLVNVENINRNPVLDYLLPSLLYVKLVALFDEVLVDFIKTNNISTSKKYRKDLNGRIELLNDQGKLDNYCDLVRLRKERNSYAHDSVKYGSWAELNKDISLVEKELIQLGYIGASPEFEFFSERSGAKESADKKVAFTVDYKYGLKKSGNEVFTVAYTKSVHRMTESDES